MLCDTKNLINYKCVNDIQQRFSELRGRIICISAPPGAGKTSLCKSLAHYLTLDGIPAKHFAEHVNIMLLEAYLANPKQYGFTFQAIMIQRRIATYIEAVNYAKTGGIALVDGPINTDLAFELMNYENGNITETEHKIYLNMLKEYEYIDPPDYIVYLDVSPETARRRLIKRGRESEINNYNENYYASLHEYNRRALGNLKVSVIPYNTDDTFDNLSVNSMPVTKEYAYQMLDKIKTRNFESEGLTTDIGGIEIKISDECLANYKYRILSYLTQNYKL